jgi:enoyl-CoA hydratase
VEDKELHRGYNFGRQRVFNPNFGTSEWVDIMRFGKLEIFKPIIFAVNGPCIGGALGLLSALTDITVAAEEAKFGTVGITHAIGGAGGAELVRRLPWAIAMDMLLRGKIISAEEAYRVGFVNEIVSHDELIPAATAIAEEIAANPPLHVQSVKHMAISSRELSPASLAWQGTILSAVLQSVPDSREGPKAFMEKRKAIYTGKVD